MAGRSALLTSGPVTLTVRLATRRDAGAILDIYNHYVTNTVVTFDMVPRVIEDQLAWIDAHSGGHPAVVAEDELGVVVGYGSLSPFRSRPAYSATVEDSVYLHPEHTGEGIGRAILEELLRLAAIHGFHSVVARIAGNNEPSVRLHASCGFEPSGIEREVGRKHRQWIDVVQMQRML